MAGTVRVAKAVRTALTKRNGAASRRDDVAAAARCQAQIAELRRLIHSKTEAEMVADMAPAERQDYEAMRKRMRILHMTDKELMKIYYQMKRERYRR